MSRIENRWIDDGAVNNRVLDNSDSYNVAGLSIDQGGTPNLYVKGDSSMAGGLNVDGTVVFSSGLSMNDSTVNGDLWITDNLGVGISSPSANRVMIRSSDQFGLELNTSNSNAARFITALDSSRWDIKTSYSGSQPVLPITFSNGSTELMRLDTAGNLGIGSTNPLQKLHVVGNEYVSGTLQLGTGATVGEFSIDGTLSANSDAKLPTQKAVKTYVDAQISGENLWDRSSSTVVLHTLTDNVGIGTVSTTSQLDVYKNSSNPNTVTVRNPSSSSGSSAEIDVTDDSYTLSLAHYSSTHSGSYGSGAVPYSSRSGFIMDSSSLLIAAGGSSSLFFGTNFTVQMMVDSNGNVGIGTTYTTSQLNVYKNASSPLTVTIQNPSSSSGSSSELDITDDSQTLSLTHYSSTHSGSYGSGAVPYSSRAGFIIDSTSLLIAAGGSSCLYFGTNYTVQMMVDSNGNVGIGTTPTTAQLDVYKNSSNPVTVAVRNPSSSSGSSAELDVSADSYTLSIAHYSSTHSGSYGGGAVPYNSRSGFIMDTGNILLAAGSSSYLIFGTNFGVRMVIDSNGNVGVGTTSPDSLLHVYTSANSPLVAKIQNSNSSIAASSELDIKSDLGTLALTRYSSTASGFYDFGGVAPVPHATNSFIIDSSNLVVAAGNSCSLYLGTNGNSRVVIDSAGHVGINTSTPSTWLDVQANSVSTQDIAVFRNSLGNMAVRIRKGGSGINGDEGLVLINNAAGTTLVQLTANSALKNYFNNGNYFGVGTSNPLAQMHVVGDAYFGDNSSNVEIQLKGSSQSQLSYYVGGVSTAYIRGSSAGFKYGSNLHWFDTYGTGTVGIGASSFPVSGVVLGSYQSSYDTNNVFISFETYSDGTNETPLVVYDNSNTRNAMYVQGTGLIYSRALLGGATTLSVNASGFIIRTPSDERLKSDVQTITDALDTVEKLRGVSFKWKPESGMGDRPDIGLIAQEVEPVLPEVISKGEDGILNVNYPNIVALLIEAIKELKAEIDDLKSKLSE